MYKKIVSIVLLTSYLFSATQYSSVKFEGLTQISQSVALEVSKFSEGKSYTDKEINKALKEFFSFGYFTDVVVSSENNILTFYFTEKPFITKLEMSGYKTREDDLDELFMTMDIKKGNMYTKAKVKQSKKKLLKALEQEGYMNSVVEVEVDTENKNGIALKFVVNKGSEIIIKELNYIGAKDLDTDNFEEVTSNKELDSFSWWFGRNDGVIDFDQLSYDGFRIKEEYLKHGYLDAKVETPFSKIDFNTNTAVIDINIAEGKKYTVSGVTIYVDEKIADPEEIYPKLKLEKNDIFNIKKLRKDQEYIKTLVANKGYAFTQVNYDIRQDKKNGTANIIYNVIPGEKVYINDVIISGNSRTLDRVIRRNIYLAPKDLFSITDFKDSKNALNRTGFFDTVTIEQQRVSKNQMNLIVSVIEAPTGNLIFGGGYGSYDGFMINASVNDKNIFGSGLNLGFSVDWSSKQTTYDISLRNPAINDGKYSGSVSAYQKESDITYTDYELTTKTTGMSVGVGKSLTRHTHAGINYSLKQTADSYDTKPENNTEYKISSLTPYINFNNTDSYYNPRAGKIATTSLEFAGVGGDVKYLKSLSSYKYFNSLEDQLDFDMIFRYRANLRLLQSSGYAPQSNTFYLGGVNTLRGYKSYAFGPESDEKPYERMFSNSLELSMPFIPSAKMRWGIFYDYGMIGETKFDQIKRSGAGALVEWMSPVGPLQFIFSEALDAKYGDSTASFEFSLGSKF